MQLDRVCEISLTPPRGRKIIKTAQMHIQEDVEEMEQDDLKQERQTREVEETTLKIKKKRTVLRANSHYQQPQGLLGMDMGNSSSKKGVVRISTNSMNNKVSEEASSQ